MIIEKNNVIVIDESSAEEFARLIDESILKGYKINSTNCGFVNSEKYDFCASYQAILIKKENSNQPRLI